MESNGYIEKYPDISHAARAVAVMLSNEVILPKPEVHYELEARFGRLNPSLQGGMVFENGVSSSSFHQALSNMQLYRHWSTVSETEEMHDFFYSIKTEGDNIDVRTTTRFGVNKQGIIQVEHLHKRVLRRQDCKYHSEDLKELDFAYDIRVSLSSEQQVAPELIPDFVTPSFVRIKQRKNFYYGTCKDQKPLWMFSFTQSWSGGSLSEAETKQKTKSPLYEIECECLDIQYYLEQPHHDELYLAASLLLKMKDFGDRERPFWLEPLPQKT